MSSEPKKQKLFQAMAQEGGDTPTRTYIDGMHRPLLRGWMHLFLALGGYWWCLQMYRERDERWELILVLLLKSMSLTASAHLHILDQRTPLRYAVANAIDFACLPLNGGSILAITTPRSLPWLRLLHALVMVSFSIAIVFPVYRWTLLVCKKELEAAVAPHKQRGVLSVACALWIYIAWAVQAGIGLHWCGYLLFLLIGYFFWNAQYMGVPPLPWHGEYWASHDDFHVCGVVADMFALSFAFNEASSMVAASTAVVASATSPL